MSLMRLDFASDNTAGICPEALDAISRANRGSTPSYGDDSESVQARGRFAEIFERPCEAFFVFNGTAANSLSLAALCQRHHGIICHQLAHIATDECGAPEFFTGGAKLLTVGGPGAKLRAADLEEVLHRGHGVHAPKPRAISLTQATELGTRYKREEMESLREFAQSRGLLLQMDGARFANAVAASLGTETPASLSWRAGIDVLCLGGTKNGLLGSEVVLFFRSDLAREFEYRVKQSGQLASKGRFAAAQWNAVLRDGAWLKHAGHANAQAAKLSRALTELGGELIVPTEANGIFIRLDQPRAKHLESRGWQFYKFIGDDGYRFMCSWATTDAAVEELVADFKASVGKQG